MLHHKGRHVVRPSRHTMRTFVSPSRSCFFSNNIITDGPRNMPNPPHRGFDTTRPTAEPATPASALADVHAYAGATPFATIHPGGAGEPIHRTTIMSGPSIDADLCAARLTRFLASWNDAASSELWGGASAVLVGTGVNKAGPSRTSTRPKLFPTNRVRATSVYRKCIPSERKTCSDLGSSACSW